MQSDFRVEVHTEGRATVIAVGGELDLASAPALESELEAAAQSDAALLVLDLRELEFMDSTGLSVIVKAHQRLSEEGRTLSVVRGPQQVQRLLDLTGVAERLQLGNSPEEILGGV